MKAVGVTGPDFIRTCSTSANQSPRPTASVVVDVTATSVNDFDRAVRGRHIGLTDQN